MLFYTIFLYVLCDMGCLKNPYDTRHKGRWYKIAYVFIVVTPYRKYIQQ